MKNQEHELDPDNSRRGNGRREETHDLTKQAIDALGLLSQSLDDHPAELDPRQTCRLNESIEQLLISTSSALRRSGNAVVDGQMQHPVVYTAGDARTNALHARQHMFDAAEQLDRASQLSRHACHMLQAQYRYNEDQEAQGSK